MLFKIIHFGGKLTLPRKMPNRGNSKYALLLILETLKNKVSAQISLLSQGNNIRFQICHSLSMLTGPAF